MQIPSKEQFSRIFAIIEEFDHLRESELLREIGKLRAEGEPTEVVTYLRLNYSLPAAPEFELLPGERIAERYTIEEQIGAGGMGIVYRAKQDRTHRDVALKLVHPRLSTPALLGRFEEEIVTLGKLDHPGIVHIFDADKHGDTIFFTMQLVDGQPLHRHLRQQALTRHQKLDLVIRLAEAVQAAHDRAIIHRDLKPGNILIDRHSGHPVILDFGLATISGAMLADDDRQITGLSGTPNYMSPEQFLGTAGEFGAGQSIDVYALGVIAFEILAGHLPYQFPEDSSWIDKRRVVLEEPPLPMGGEPELENAVRKAIRKNPGDRYFTASGFAKALKWVQRKLASPEDVEPVAWRPAAGATVPSTDWILERMLGEGGIGQVWLAKHPVLGERRVFKFCEDDEKVRSLKREASLFRLLKEKIGHHPNIVRLHDVSLDDPPYFLAMDYIEGGDLQTWAEAQGGIGRVPLTRRLEIVAQAASTLQAAHDAGILHRDIKPSNLLIAESDGQIKTYVADFGIGQLLGEDELGNTRLGFTRTVIDKATDSLAGSQRYMAPELLGGSPASVRSDIYSMGVVLYQMIIGDFNRALTVDWYQNIDDPLLEDDLKNCFSGNPEARFSSAQQLADNLHSLDQRRRHEADLAAAANQLERRAYRRGLIRAGLISAAIIISLAWLSWFSYQKYHEAWRNESRFRLAEVRALRESSVPERRRLILERIEEPGGKFPDGDIPAFRNEALAALSIPPPYGSREIRLPSITASRTIASSGAWFAWPDGSSVAVAQLDGEGLGKIQPLRFNSEISSVAISDGPNGWIVAVLSEGGTLGVAAAGGGRLEQIGEGCGTRGVSVHQSGMIAASRDDGLVQLFKRRDGIWERGSVMGTRPPELTPDSSAATDPGPFTCSSNLMAFSRDRRFLATGGGDSLYVQIWDVETAARIGICRHTSYPTALSWDPITDGQLWSASADSAVFSWKVPDSPAVDLDLHPLLSRKAEPTGLPIRAIDASPNGVYIACASDDGGLKFLSRSTLEIEGLRGDAGVAQCAYLPSGDFWVTGSDGTVRLRLAEQNLARVWSLGSEAILRLTWNPDKSLIAASCGKNVIISDLSYPAWIERLRGRSRINGVSFSATEPIIFAAGVKEQYAWEWDDNALPRTFDRSTRDGNRAIGGLAVSVRSADGGRWVAFSIGPELIARNAMGADGDRSEWIIGGNGVITAVAAGRNTPWIAVARAGGSPTQLCYPDSRSVRPLPNPPGDVVSLACPPDGSLLVQRTADQIILLDTPSAAVLATYDIPLPPPDDRTSPFHCAPIAISDDGILIAGTTLGPKITLFHRDSATAVADLPLPPNSTPTAMLFTAQDGLVVGTADGNLWSWEIATMRGELKRLGIDW